MTQEQEGQRVVPFREIAERVSQIMDETGSNLAAACWKFLNEPPDNPLKRMMRDTWEESGRELMSFWFYQSAELDLKDLNRQENT